LTGEIVTEVEIEAPPERVWEELTAFDSYPDWNPFIRRLRGRAARGERLEGRVQPPGSRGTTFKPEVLVAEKGRELRWRGRFLVPGLFDGEHYFLIEPRDENRVRFVQGEKFSGLLVPLLWKGLSANLLRGFEEMNQALKERAEESAARGEL